MKLNLFYNKLNLINSKKNKIKNLIFEMDRFYLQFYYKKN